MNKLPNEILEIILNNLSASDIDLINFGKANNSFNNNKSRIFNFILYYFLKRLKLKSKIKLIESIINKKNQWVLNWFSNMPKVEDYFSRSNYYPNDINREINSEEDGHHIVRLMVYEAMNLLE